MLYDQQSIAIKELLTRSQFAQITFSQFGEDIMMIPFLESRGMLRDGFYVDVGAHDPFRMSNTAIYYHCYGWRGINIEANPAAVAEFNRHRPHDTNVQAVVSDSQEEVAFHIFNHPAVSTADAGMLQLQQGNSHMEVVETMRTYPVSLASVLDKFLPTNQPVRLLSIDVEGYDLRCLRSNDWAKYRPYFILIEDHEFRFNEMRENSIHHFLTGKSYELVSRCVISNFYFDTKSRIS